MFKVLTDGCDPTKGTKHSACVDLYASEDVTIGAGETKLIGLGVAIDLEYLHKNVDVWCGHPYPLRPDGLVSEDYDEHLQKMHGKNFNYYMNNHYLQLMLRSSLSKQLIIANGVGVIDLDYKDEIKIRLHNPMENPFTNTSDPIGSCLEEHTPVRGVIKKGDKIAQITLLEHKSYLFGIESDVERDGGFGSTDEKKD